jgi:hypothetical protein
MRARTGAAGPAIFTSFLALDALLWAEIFLRRRIELSELIVGVSFVVVYWLHEHILVDRGHGLDFDTKFVEFSVRKQVALCLTSTVLIVAVGLSFYFTVQVYHRTFNI